MLERKHPKHQNHLNHPNYQLSRFFQIHDIKFQLPQVFFRMVKMNELVDLIKMGLQLEESKRDDSFGTVTFTVPVNLIENGLMPVEAERESDAIFLRRRSDHLAVLRRELTLEGREEATPPASSSFVNYWISLEQFSVDERHELSLTVSPKEKLIMKIKKWKKKKLKNFGKKIKAKL
jgi:hypothetical protein